MNKRAKKILFLLFTAVFCFAIALPSIFAVPSQSVSPEVFSAYEIEAGLVPETSANQATDGENMLSEEKIAKDIIIALAQKGFPIEDPKKLF